MTWADIDWAVLDRLRALFLSGDTALGPYWTSPEDLAHYDCTYGERIGWKWDAVLQELDQHGWKPPSSLVLDWGCGSGVAGRRVVRWLGAERVSALRLWDHSALAADFAGSAARARFPQLAVEPVTPGFLASDGPVGVLVISHVLNELPAEELLALRGLAARADAILWVEPGTPAVSRGLIAIREQLRDRFRLVAPCTHQAACGLLASGNARHWCHHFAKPPVGIFADSGWVKFGQRAGIDLRSLPYSFLALQRTPRRPDAESAPGFSRVIGEPRLYKGFAKVLNCDAAGVTELVLQKRDAPELFRLFKRPTGALVYRWNRREGKILGGEPLSR
jgi:hypothetical protein